MTEAAPARARSVRAAAPIPIGLLAELTHRCPLQCPYCSNPQDLERANTELDAAAWVGVLQQAAKLGVLQLHLSGGEPTARKDLEEILAGAVEAGLYTNLITSGVLLSRERLDALARIGLDHVQVSIQDVEPANADRLAACSGAHAKKLELAGWVVDAGMALTINAPMHRQNLASLERIVDLAVAMRAGRLEVAHIQYYGWALRNRAALMPAREDVMRSIEIVDKARERLKGILVIDLVVPDYYASRPKPCVGGWGRSMIAVTPSGTVLPCHAAQSIPGLKLENVRSRPLADIWRDGPAFTAFRGTDWMREPCRTCDRREIDWGGCRCQAYAMAGDAAATDPACALSPRHAELMATAEREAAAAPPEFAYRRFRAST